MNNNFEHFDEFIFVDKILVEAEFFNGPQYEQFVIYLQIQPCISENLQYFMVIHRVFVVLFLLEIECPLFRQPQWKQFVILKQFIANLMIYSVILRMGFYIGDIGLCFFATACLLYFSCFVHYIFVYLRHRHIKLIDVHAYLCHRFAYFSFELPSVYLLVQLIHVSYFQQHFILCIQLLRIHINKIFAFFNNLLIFRVCRNIAVMVSLLVIAHLLQKFSKHIVSLGFEIIHNKQNYLQFVNDSE